MPKLFISYRRADSDDIAGRIYDHFAAHYGSDSVFMDVEAIPPGVDFRDHVTEWIASCDALIVIVGEEWLDFSRDDGKRSLDNPTDPVRIEISAALKRGVPVIPVLTANTVMPTSEQLPDEIENFAYRNAVTIRSGRNFLAHVERLMRDIDSIVGVSDNDVVSPALDRMQTGSEPRKPASSFRLKAVADFFPENLDILYRILTERTAFIDSIQHGTAEEFARAAKYMVFLSLMGVVMAFPALKIARVDVSVSFLIIDTVISVVLFFVLGVMNHIVAKLLGGSASLRSSVVVTVYISSIAMIANIIMLLVPNWVAGLITGSDSMDNAEAYEAMFENMMIDEVFAIVLFFIASLYWIGLQGKAFGHIHGFKWIRTSVFVVLSLLAISLYGEMSQSVIRNYHQPFIQTSIETPTGNARTLESVSARLVRNLVW